MGKRETRAAALAELADSIERAAACHDPDDPIPDISEKRVMGEGDPSARLVVVGEGPGAEEEKQGRPFVGRAGRFLRDGLREAGLDPDTIYITNVVKCRPFRIGSSGRKSNRAPTAEQRRRCLPYLLKELEIVSPELVLLLGSIAARTFLGPGFTLARERGRAFERHGLQVVATYHPSAVFRNPHPRNHAIREALREDLRAAARRLEAAERSTPGEKA